VGRPVRALLVATHPVQYAVPQYRRLAADPRVDATVAFLSMHGAEVGLDPDFGVRIRWDVPLLDGYRWRHPPNRSPRSDGRGFLGLVNTELWRLIRRGGFDVVVCHGYRAVSFWIAALAARVSGAGLVWTTDATSLGSRDGSGLKRRVKAVGLPLVFRTGAAVFVPSSRGAEFLRTLGLPRERVFMTPYVVDNDYFAATAAEVDVTATRATFDVPSDHVVVAFVGKLVLWKRPWDVLRAAARVPRVTVLMAGDGSERSTLERLSRELGMEDRVRFLGFTNQSQLPAVYATADILVHPSEHEPFGLVVNEAFACGTGAFVTEACGCADDLIISGVTGDTFPVGDVDALADLLRSLVHDRGRAARLGEGARARIAEWDLERWADDTVDALTYAASRGRRRRRRVARSLGVRR